MRHKWGNGNVCLRCGLEREKLTVKTLMAIVNHPPWNVYKYESKWHYLIGNKLTTQRPECKTRTP